MQSKRFVSVVLGLALGLLVFGVAQAENDKYLELVRQDLQTGKIAYMTEGMDLSSEKGEIFWPLYRDYLNSLSVIGDRRIALIKDYAVHWEDMTREKATEIMKTSFKLRKDRLGLLEKTAKKVAKDLDPITAARFVQVESALNLIIDVQLTSEIPLFEEGPGQ